MCKVNIETSAENCLLLATGVLLGIIIVACQCSYSKFHKGLGGHTSWAFDVSNVVVGPGELVR